MTECCYFTQKLNSSLQSLKSKYIDINMEYFVVFLLPATVSSPDHSASLTLLINESLRCEGELKEMLEGRIAPNRGKVER